MSILPSHLFQYICDYLHGYEVYRLNKESLALYKHKWLRFRTLAQHSDAGLIQLLPLLNIWRWFCGCCDKKNWNMFRVLFFSAQATFCTVVYEHKWRELLYNQSSKQYASAAALVLKFPVSTSEDKVPLAIHVFCKMYLREAVKELSLRIEDYRLLDSVRDPNLYTTDNRHANTLLPYFTIIPLHFQFQRNDFLKKCLRGLHVSELAVQRLFTPLLIFFGEKTVQYQELQERRNHFEAILQRNCHIPSFCVGESKLSINA